MNELITSVLYGAVAAAITMVLMDRMERRKVKKEVENEIEILRAALKAINETHNSLMLMNSQNKEELNFLSEKLNILSQGVPGNGKQHFGR